MSVPRYEHEFASTPARRLCADDPGPIATELLLDAGGAGLALGLLVLGLLAVEALFIASWLERW